MSEFLETRRWLEGPEFLWKHEENWPQTKLDISLDSGDREVRKEAVAYAVTVNAASPTDQLISHYSDWMRLKRAVAWYLKLKDWIKEKCERRKMMGSSANGNSVACNAIQPPERHCRP